MCVCVCARARARRMQGNSLSSNFSGREMIYEPQFYVSWYNIPVKYTVSFFLFFFFIEDRAEDPWFSLVRQGRTIHMSREFVST